MRATSRRELAAVLAAGMQRSAAQAMGIALACKHESRIHLLSWSVDLIHLSARLVASLQRIMSSLCLKLSGIGTTSLRLVRLSALLGHVQPGVCTRPRGLGTWFLAHNRASVFMQLRVPYSHPASVISSPLFNYVAHTRTVRRPVLRFKSICSGSHAWSSHC
jgi:hypothetical protein